jgi:hypothetical protein
MKKVFSPPVTLSLSDNRIRRYHLKVSELVAQEYDVLQKPIHRDQSVYSAHCKKVSRLDLFAMALMFRIVDN